MNMLTGDFRSSQWTNFFRSLEKPVEKINQRSKRFRQKDGNTPGTVLDAPSTSTLIVEKL